MRIALLVLFLAGCQSVPSLTPEQLNAMPSGATFCATGTGIWGTVKVTYAKLEGTAQGGNVVVDSNTCGTTIVSNAAVVAAARAAAAAAAQARQP
ncbi:MAG TPA: hypothetical protein VHQ92_01055 [Pseudolabrys sp.]|nr:hypothetical protein [Pseudolabrys sp.]